MCKEKTETYPTWDVTPHQPTCHTTPTPNKAPISFTEMIEKQEKRRPRSDWLLLLVMCVPFSYTSHLLMPLFGWTGRVVKMSMFQVQGRRGVEWGTLFESIGKRGKRKLGLNWFFTFLCLCVLVLNECHQRQHIQTHPGDEISYRRQSTRKRNFSQKVFSR